MMKKMTEQEWLTCDRPHWLLQHLRPWKKRARKMTLYVCASFRRSDHLAGAESYRRLIDVIERYIDGAASSQDYSAAKREIRRAAELEVIAVGDRPHNVGQGLLACLKLQHSPGWEGSHPQAKRFNYLSEEAKNNREALRCSGEAVITEDRAVDLQREIEAFDLDHVVLLRDIFGNPFRYTAIDLAWLSWNVITLAQGIYADRAFDQLPVLADMLEDAGCTDTDILDHCRGPGPHVRGCWVVDLLLGKE